MTQAKRPTQKGITPPTKVRSSRTAVSIKEKTQSDNQYQRAKKAFKGKLSDEFYVYLHEHRLDDPSLCLGYYLMRAAREQNLNQSDVAARTATKTLPQITRSFISTLLNGTTGIRAESWIRIAKALDANPLEFFQAEGWVKFSDIAAYKVPNSRLMMPITAKIEEIRPEFQQAAIAMMLTVLNTVIIQQIGNESG